MDDIDNSNAQLPEDAGQQAPQTDTAQTPENLEAAQHRGLQKRFDELTREKYEAQRARDEMAAQVARLAGQMADFQSRPQAPVEPGVALDPEQKRVFDSYFQPYLQEIRAANERANQLAQVSRFDQLAAQEDPRVAERARQLMPKVAQIGLPIEDAFTFARGEIAKAQVAGGGRGQATNSHYAAITSQGTVPPPVNPNVASLPANFDRLPLDEQLRILERRGAADAPI